MQLFPGAYGQEYSEEYTTNGGSIDKFPRVAEKLETLRDSLPQQAAKAYHALQLALQPHSRPNGSRPHFEKDFRSSLQSIFPHAANISTHQIGSWNQWEVTIDSGPAIFCSVRLEVLTDDATFVKELKAKARVVKDTLMEEHGKWKKALQPGLGFSFETLSQFEKECAQRISWNNGADGQKGPDGQKGGGSGGSRQGWQEDRPLCQICKKSVEDDQLAGEHMCVVSGSFQCTECGNSWTSYHARLKPDGETLSGQSCSKCQSPGYCKEWRLAPRDDDDTQNYGHNETNRRSKGMHQSALCHPCLEFGNCMGMFYDPFVLTHALSLVTNQMVQWRGFSETMPELLVADLGPQFEDLQVCLQPHVYISPSDFEAASGPPRSTAVNGSLPRSREQLRSGHSPARDLDRQRGPVRNELARSRGPRGKPQYDEYDPDYDRHSGRYDAAEQSQPSQQEDYSQPPAPPRRDREVELQGPRREAGGVKDQHLFDSFLSKVGARMNDSEGSRSQPKPVSRSRDAFETQQGATGYDEEYAPAASFGDRRATEAEAAEAEAAWQMAEATPSYIGSQTSNGYGEGRAKAKEPEGARGFLPQEFLKSDEPVTRAPVYPVIQAAGPEPSKKKSNKMGSSMKSGSGQPSGSATHSTPMLDLLPPLRRAQFLQIVLKQVKASGGVVAHKAELAEEYLTKCEGDYDKAYKYVKSLSEAPVLQ